MCECVGAKEPAVTERGDGAASKDRDGGGGLLSHFPMMDWTI